MTGETQTVLCAVADGIATVTLNRPEQRNAFNQQMCKDLLGVARALAVDDAVRVVVVRGAGPAFCAGADLKERHGMTEDQVRARRVAAFAAYDAIENLPMPTLAAVHGPAVGSGCEIATACDFIIAAEIASFRYPEALRGTVGATQRLPRLVGKARAKELLFTGRAVLAGEAHRLGLVAKVVPDAALDQAVRDTAAAIAAAPPQSMRLAKRCIDRGMETDRAGALAIELMAIEESLAGPEWRVGAAAFADKKPGP